MTIFRYPWAKFVRRFGADERGSMAIMFGVLIALGTIASALAVDEGSLYLQRRTAQSAVDLASIAAANDPANAFAIVRQHLVDAGLVASSATQISLADPNATTRLVVQTGKYSADSTLAVGQRFQVSNNAINAVRVSFVEPGTLFFARPWAQTQSIGVRATASVSPQVAFSIGSTLVNMSDGIPNAVLNALLGSNVSLSAVSYDALLSTKISLFPFLDALAQELGITAGTYQDVLNASADQGVIAKAMADVLTGTDKTAMTTLAQALGHNGTVPISQLFSLGNAAGLSLDTGASSGYVATLSALQVLSATTALSNGTHQVSLNLAANVPGLVSLTMSLAVGEPAQFASWFSLGPSGSIVHTSQIRMRFVATIGGGLALLNASVRVPLYLAVAYAQAGVQSATCPASGATTGTAVINTQPGVASLTLGDVPDPAFSNFSATPTVTPATLINLLLLKVNASASASIGQTTPTPLSFSAADITSGTVKRATTTTFTQSLMASLLQTLTLTIAPIPLGLTIGGVTSTLNSLLSPLTPVLDSAINVALAALGVTLGDADVQVYDVTCTSPVLVQ